VGSRISFKASAPDLFAPERFPVFGADITTTGYYGFPLNRDGIVQVSQNHGPGLEMSPDLPNGPLLPRKKRACGNFCRGRSRGWPMLQLFTPAYACTAKRMMEISGSRPIRNAEGLVIAAGDCGHGFKFAPVRGEIIADAVEVKPNPILEKFVGDQKLPVAPVPTLRVFQGDHDQTAR
jgi:glycine/D-amino acid oxidase-like deaminating enzyme